MTKWAMNYDSGEFEEIDRNGFSLTRGEFTCNWDDSEYRREEEERRRREEDERNRQDRWFSGNSDDMLNW